MKTDKVIAGLDPELCQDPGDLEESLTAAAKKRRKQFDTGPKYTPETQPRQYDGRFLKILARLKQDLGQTELEDIQKQIKKAEEAHNVGDYGKATRAAQSVIKQVDAIKDGTLDQSLVKNLRQGAAELGRVLAYLPLPKGVPTAKIRFSDLPPSTQRLVHGLLDRVNKKLTEDKALDYTEKLRQFIAGTIYMTNDQISAELNRLLRVLA